MPTGYWLLPGGELKQFSEAEIKANPSLVAGAKEVATGEAPPTVVAPSVAEEKVVEYLQKSIEGPLKIIADRLDYDVGDIYTVKGTGSIFSGDYYVREVSFCITAGEIELTLDVIRTNLNPTNENLSGLVYGTASPEINSTRTPKPIVDLPQKTITKHVVVKGDTLWDLAMHYYKDGLKWKVIADANKITYSNVDKIQVGTELIIPQL